MDAAIANARHGAFSDAFFFGVETISTIVPDAELETEPG
jgi:hypothetical protein